MNDQGRLTGWTCLLLLAGIVLVVTGALLAPPGKVYVWVLVAAWIAVMSAANRIYLKARAVIREQQIRADERARLSGPGGRP
jgi:hypothetical protein